MKSAVRVLFTTFGVTGVTMATAATDLPPNTAVRIQSSAIGGGWLTGKLRTSPNGCTMIHLDRPTSVGNYTSVALNSTNRLQRVQGGTWEDVAVKPLLAKEPKDCREADND